MDICQKKGVEFITKKVRNIERDHVICDDGVKYKAKYVVDCSGHFNNMTHYEEGQSTPAMQIFYGEVFKVKKHDYPLDTFVLMDFRYTENEEIPTFVYVMPIDETTLFMEETILVTKKKVSYQVLKNKLYDRIKRYGIEKLETVEVEEDYFLMGGTLPSRSNQHLCFGASSRMVHPCTVFMMGFMLNQSGRVASALIDMCKDS